VDSVGVNEAIIRRYVRHQDKEELEYENQLELLKN
ncbi:IS200/IS605 family transposase, partial [Photobacterium chitinilyticum]